MSAYCNLVSAVNIQVRSFVVYLCLSTCEVASVALIDFFFCCPWHELGQGHELLGHERLWCCAVHDRDYGEIMGKCTETECWYGWRGREYHRVGGFEIFKGMVLDPDLSNPADRMKFSFRLFQHGYGFLWFALADTPYGKIPGKASKDKCWYTYAGVEYMTTTGFVYFRYARDIMGPYIADHYQRCLECYLAVRSSAFLQQADRCADMTFVLLSGRAVRPADPGIRISPQTFVCTLNGISEWVYVDDGSLIQLMIPLWIVSCKSCLEIGHRDPIGLFNDDVVQVLISGPLP